MERNNVIKELVKMSSAERILLAQDLWDSVADNAESWVLTPDQERELDRRLNAYQSRKSAGKAAGSSWQQVKRRLRSKS